MNSIRDTNQFILELYTLYGDPISFNLSVL